MAQIEKLTVAVLIAACFLGMTFAYSGVALKSGDWIEYTVTVTGNPTAIHNITWARLDVVSIEGPAVNADIQTMLGNGTLWLEPDTTLNVATGAVGEGAIIPTNLTVGDVYLTQYEGNITVTGTETLLVGGAQRTVLCGSANHTSYCWDKQTGVMVKGATTLDDCVVYSELSRTNLWQPQISGLDANVFYSLVTLVVVTVVAIVLVALIKRSHKNFKPSTKTRI